MTPAFGFQGIETMKGRERTPARSIELSQIGIAIVTGDARFLQAKNFGGSKLRFAAGSMALCATIDFRPGRRLIERQT